MLRSKQTLGAEANVIPYNLYQKLSKKPLQKIYQPLKAWLATKSIHQLGCVRLPTQYRNRKIDLLYLVVNGNFTPLLSCSGCLDLEVLQFMNLDLIKGEHAVPVTKQDQDLLPDTITSDPILTNFKNASARN